MIDNAINQLRLFVTFSY